MEILKMSRRSALDCRATEEDDGNFKISRPPKKGSESTRFSAEIRLVILSQNKAENLVRQEK
jgi:hypothetical protein